MASSNSDDSYSRRDFLKTAALGLGGATLLPSMAAWGCGSSTHPSNTKKYYETWREMEALPDEEKLNIALVGLGGYAGGQLAPALQETKRCKLNGIVTGTPAKRDRWGSRYGIPEANMYNYETMNRIADNDDIDIIYIVLPSGMHAEYAIKAAETGKHVICEKPMATSVEDCQAIIDACNSAGVKLSIGYRLHFEPHHEEVMRLGQQQAYGPVQKVSGSFAYTMSGNNPDIWRLDKELAGGGPLLDLGIYAVQGAIYTTGELPESVTAEKSVSRPELFDEVEETIRWTFTFPSGATAEGMSSYGGSGNHHRMESSDGFADLQPAFSYGGVDGRTSEGAMDYPGVNQQKLQMDAFANCILEDRDTRVPGEMGLRDVKLMMGIYEAAETGEEITYEWGDTVPIDS